MKRRMVTGLVLIGSVLVSGVLRCDADASESGRSIPGRSPMDITTLHSVSRMAVQKVNSYRAGMRRDPFVPLNQGQLQRTPDVDHSKASGGVSDIPKVLGIVSGRKGHRAVLQRANGQRILVGPGSVLEAEHARVSHISDDTVFLEYRWDENGKTRLRERRLSIQHSEKTSGSPQG